METFILTVTYKGAETELPVTLVNRGYTYGIAVTVQGWELMLEPDEEGKLRVITANQDNASKEPDPELVKSVVETLQSLRS